MNARKRLTQVTALGGEFRKAFIAKSGEYYIVQTGVFEIETNAKKMEAELKSAGIDSFVKER